MSSKDFILNVLKCARGDDLYRARAAFRRCTPEEMQQEYGESGKTRAQIIREYEEHDGEYESAIKWLESISE